jgi:hypothetical protein
MPDAALARRLSKLRSIREVAPAPTAERHLDRLLGRALDRAGGVRRETPRP